MPRTHPSTAGSTAHFYIRQLHRIIRCQISHGWRLQWRVKIVLAFRPYVTPSVTSRPLLRRPRRSIKTSIVKGVVCVLPLTFHPSPYIRPHVARRPNPVLVPLLVSGRRAARSELAIASDASYTPSLIPLNRSELDFRCPPPFRTARRHRCRRRNLTSKRTGAE